MTYCVIDRSKLVMSILKALCLQITICPTATFNFPQGEELGGIRASLDANWRIAGQAKQ